MTETALDRKALERLTFGELLRYFRRRKNWSLEKLSEATEIDVAYLSRLENAKKDNPIGPLLGCIANALELESAERFLFFTKALEAKYGRRHIFGQDKQDESANRVYEAIWVVLGSLRSALRSVRDALGRILASK